MRLALVLVGLLAVASAKTFLKETFDGNWQSRWIESDWKKSEGSQGKWAVTAGKWYGDADRDKGLQTTQDARFYTISTAHEQFSNKGKDLVIQFSVKHEQNIDCGGAYLKLFPAGTNQEHLAGGANESPYNIMFGPDICGTSTRRVHVIFNYKGKNHLIKKDIKAETDQLTHVYTLIVHPDNTYEVKIDLKEVAKGSLYDDWDFLKPRKIKDPNVSKPSDWVDDKTIADPEDKKPAGWDDAPAKIPDPDAEKPDDWDDEDDGEWEAPMIDNPEYKGPWKARQIPNPAYKGPWEHPLIDNPEFEDDANIYAYDSFKVAGFEIWQVKAGTLFDNIIITDSVKEAEDFANETWAKSKDAEKKAYDDAQDAKRKEEEAARPAEDEADEPEEDDEEDKTAEDAKAAERKAKLEKLKAKAKDEL
jgi:calreticulin